MATGSALAQRGINLPPSLQMDRKALIETLKSSLYPGAKDETVEMIVGWCQATGKDPMKRPVHAVPMQVKDAKTGDYEWRDVLMPGIGDYRTDASRTGEYAGIDEAKFGPTVELTLGGESKMVYDKKERRKVQKGDWEKISLKVPEWCEITVYRLIGGVRCPFSSGKIRWLEAYVTAGGGTTLPNAMWRKRTWGQLEKCAEAMALRRGFPEAVGSQPTREEMEGRVVDVDVVDAGTVTVQMPKSTDAPHGGPPASPAADAPPKPTATPGAAEGPGLSENQVKTLRERLTAAKLTEAELCKANSLNDADGKDATVLATGMKADARALAKWIRETAASRQ